MNCVVLVKQVPDLSDLRPDAWDTEKGTLRRGVLDSILNPLDAHALNLANRIRRDGGRIIALTMGPPQAEEMLRECLSRCADEAVLLTDRAFAGADTCATAYALAHAIRRLVEQFQLGQDYVVVSGMQSTDGDTAQVPGQVAEELGLEQIAYSEKAEWQDGGLWVHRIGPRGKEVLSPKRFPVLITAAGSDVPVHRSFHRARAALKKTIIRWSAADLGLPREKLGLAGSRTQVVRIFSPSDTRESECRLCREPTELLEAIRQAWELGPESRSEEEASTYDLAGREPAYHGEVWVFAEQEEGTLHPVCLELLGTARRLAAPLGVPVGAVLPGYGVRPLAETLVAHGADRVYVLEHPLLEDFRPIPYARALAGVIRNRRPQIVLFGATPLGRELAPRVAYASESGLTADCTQLAIGDFTREKRTHVGVLLQTRPALGGNIMATIVTRHSATQMATVRPGVMKALPADRQRRGEVVELQPELSPEMIQVELLSRQPLAGGARLTEAEIIVSGGHGLGSRENFERYIPPLAQALGEWLDVPWEVGASRAAVEDGFIGRDHQVGQTGQTVQPRLYVAVAISGAIQHISGMQNSGLIVALNKDPHAPIFRHAHLGMVGEFETVVPSLVNALQQLSPVAS